MEGGGEGEGEDSRRRDRRSVGREGRERDRERSSFLRLGEEGGAGRERERDLRGEALRRASLGRSSTNVKPVRVR